MFLWYLLHCYANKLHVISSWRIQLDCAVEVQCVTIAPIIDVRLSEYPKNFTEIYIAEVISYPFLGIQGKFTGKTGLRDPTLWGWSRGKGKINPYLGEHFATLWVLRFAFLDWIFFPVISGVWLMKSNLEQFFTLRKNDVAVTYQFTNTSYTNEEYL